jgi:pentatricopeptide repeat protein
MAKKSIWPDAPLTNALLKCAAQAGRSELAERLSRHAGKLRSSTSGNAAAAKDGLSRQVSMIKAYARDHDLASATKVFKNFCSSGTALNSMIYNSYLDACVQCGDLNAAILHFQEMKQLNILDVVGYNILLKAYLSKGRSEEAQALAKEMTAAGFQQTRLPSMNCYMRKSWRRIVGVCGISLRRCKRLACK